MYMHVGTHIMPRGLRVCTAGRGDFCLKREKIPRVTLGNDLL